jgi:hypothetical protein
MKVLPIRFTPFISQHDPPSITRVSWHTPIKTISCLDGRRILEQRKRPKTPLRDFS